MAIPVLFSAELFAFNDLGAALFDDSVAALNDELRAFFDDKVDLAGSAPSDSSNVVNVDTVLDSETNSVPTVQATVVVGFRNVSLDEAAELAEQFTSPRFKNMRADTLDPDASAAVRFENGQLVVG